MDTVRNDHLERCMRAAGYTPKTLAENFGMVEKTVRRWLTGPCTPYPNHQYAVAALLHVDRDELWPEPAPADQAAATDLVTLYNDRLAVPAQLWHELINSRGHLDLLGNNLSWLIDTHPGVVHTLTTRALRGDRVQLLLLNPEQADTTSAPATLENAALARRSLRQLDPLLHVDRAVYAQIRLHRGSRLAIYRFADDVLVQPTLDGVSDSLSPVWHLDRATTAGPFDRYLTHLHYVWHHASLFPQYHRDAENDTSPSWTTPILTDARSGCPSPPRASNPGPHRPRSSTTKQHQPETPTPSALHANRLVER